MKTVAIYTRGGEKVITAEGLSEIVGKDRRTVTCKAKGNREIFGPGEVELLEGEAFRAFLQENQVYGNALGSGQCRVFNQEGTRKALGLFCKSATVIDWETGDVIERRELTQRERQYISIESAAELQTAFKALDEGLRELREAEDSFDRKRLAHQARGIARAIVEYVDFASET